MKARRKAVTLRFWMDADVYKRIRVAAKSWGHRTPASYFRKQGLQIVVDCGTMLR